MPKKTVSIFDEIIGYDSVKKQLLEIADIINNPEKYSKFGVSVPHGLLLIGEPGLGKTLMATCLLEAIPSWNKYILRKTKPNGAFVNEIKQVFSEASKNTPAIILLDDMDKFANADKNHPDADEYVTIQSCIDKVKKKDVFVIATVNNPRKLPEALIRRGRFDRRIFIDVPSFEDAKKIISSYLAKKKFVDSDIDTELIAHLLVGESCAALETIVNESGIAAAFEGADKITTGHMVEATMKIIHHMPNPLAVIDEHAERCAYHEAAHIIAREYFNPGSVVLSTIRSNSKSGGFTVRSSKNRILHTLAESEAHICTCLAPIAMSEHKYGEDDLGVGGDLDAAFDRVFDYVTGLCTNGFSCHSINPEGYGYDESQEMLSRREHIVASEIERYYVRTKQIVLENWDFLDKVAQALLEKQIITYKDIAEIRDSLAA